jgi:squalene-hopene/tetraprenyl-beta-curcumene cyclase
MRQSMLLFAVIAIPAFCGDWNPRLAAEYLDGREKEWFAWPTAAAPSGGPCFSCHTQMTYLLVRPALRRVLGESEPTAYEKGLLDALRARVDKTDAKDISRTFTKEPVASQAVGVEAIFAALFLAPENSASSQAAFDRLWSLQMREGKTPGAWSWFSLDLDPWETPDSRFFGATLAAMAVGDAPVGYRTRPEIQPRVDALTAYLRDNSSQQPLHNRLMLLWTSTKLPAILPETARQPLIDEALRKQQPDGGWTIESLGAWKQRPTAPPSSGSSAYATGLATFVLEQAGVPRGDPRLAHARDWLKAHQDREYGSWAASSMNKQYKPGSMQIRFMQDAATGFAALALIDGEDGRKRDTTAIAPSASPSSTPRPTWP